jgi:hypothetical protein
MTTGLSARVRSAVAVLAALVLVALGPVLAPPAAADGKVFADVAAIPQIPDQQAVILFDGGEQTLAIETAFEPSGGARFAWVVPVPGPGEPEIWAGTSGLFPTVRHVFRPAVMPREWGVTALVAWLALFGVLAALPVGSRRFTGVRAGVVTLIVGMLLAGILLPALGRAGSSPSVGDALAQVEVLSSQRVGRYDVRVIKGRDADSSPAVVAWLREQGFSLPAGVEPVMSGYVARGWVFVASKLADDGGGGGSPGRRTPEPLVVRFKTDRAVYPLALTGVGNGDLRVDLYVFGPGRASAPGFRVVRCSPTGGPRREGAEGGGGRSDSRTIPVVHPGLLRIVRPDPARGAPIATLLSGTLTPAEMASDAIIDFGPVERAGEVVWSSSGAAGVGASAAFLVVGISGVVVGGLRLVPRYSVIPPVRSLGVATLAGALLGAATWATLPKAEVITGGRRGERVAEIVLRRLEGDLVDPGRPTFGRPVPSGASVEELRAAVRAWVDAELAGYRQRGAVVVREEDSPLNYVVRAAEDGAAAEFVRYGRFGEEIAQRVELRR